MAFGAALGAEFLAAVLGLAGLTWVAWATRDGKPISARPLTDGRIHRVMAPWTFTGRWPRN